MNIVVVGTGYVGLVSGVCFAEMGNHVTCVDINTEKINNLNAGIVPIYEPGIIDIIRRNVNNKRLYFSPNLVLDNIDIVFCAVGTPPDEDGCADVHYVLDVARSVGENMNKYVVFVTKSTVPIGTAHQIKRVIQLELDKRDLSISFDVVSNPEFLKEGSAIKDFMSPDRVVIGVDSDRAKEMMSHLYRPFLLNNFRVLFTDILSAEMIKYAANAMLATRISFINDIANLCERIGANVNVVRKGIGADERIGNKFLYPGCGYGGSCFPKDIKALIKIGEQNDYQMKILQAVEEVNMSQKNILFKKLVDRFNGIIENKVIALWGLSFKPETDDMRESTSLVVINQILKQGATIKVYDPIAMEECRRRIGDVVIYSKGMYDAAYDADALLLITEWKEFRMPDWSVLKKKMRFPLVIDGRNIYERAELEKYGFEYSCIGEK